MSIIVFFFSHLSCVGYLEQCLWPLASSSVVSIAEKNSKMKNCQENYNKEEK